jgi:hypothetical protein
MATVITLTATGTNNWTVPSDWNNSSNTIEVIGAGGYSGTATTYGQSGGGGGGYGKISNISLTVGNSISYTISSGASPGNTYFTAATSDIGYASSPVGSTPGNNGGTNAQPGGLGGVGKGAALNYTGGTGGSSDSNGAGGGGGGAAGPGGNGGSGNSASGSTPGTGGGGNGTNAGTGGNGANANGGGFGGNGGTGGNYGGGGGGAGHGTSGFGSTGIGAQGVIVITYTPLLATAYWVGGNGTWDLTTTTPWSLTSGGAGSAGVPNSTSAIIFNGSSGGGTATLGANVSCASLTCTGYTGTLAQSTYTLGVSGNFLGASGMTWTGSGADTFGGNVTLVSGMTNSYTGAINFNSTTSQNITTAGVSIGSAITFNGSGGVWTLQDVLTSTSSVTVTLGTLVLNNINHSVSSISNAGTLTMGTGTLTLTGTGTVWTGGGTITAASSTIKINNASSSSKTFSGGNMTYGTLYFTGAGSGAFIVQGSNTFGTFKCDTPPHTIQFGSGTTQTINNFTVSGTAGNLMTLQSTTNGMPWYLVKSPAGVVSSDYISLQDSRAS